MYSQGQILIHLRYEYQSDKTCRTPGEYLRYYRTFRGLSTWELAERVGIVLATIKQYEHRNTPVRYEIAKALARELDIDYRCFLNSYTSFIDYPFDRLLRETRASLGLTQAQFSKEIGVSPNGYGDWERGKKRPRRQEYQKTMAALERLEVPFPEAEHQPPCLYRLRGTHRKRLTGLQALYFRYCYELHIIQKKPASVKRISFSLREDIAKLALLDRQTLFLAKTGEGEFL